MVDNSSLGVENAINSSTTFRKNYTAATPSQQTGYEASNLADQLLTSPHYRGATADVGYTPLLARFDDTYNVGIPSGLGHNLSPSATWRATLDDSYAVRPAWQADGVDDSATTAETVPETTDITIFSRLYIPPSGLDTETIEGQIIRISNTANGFRLRITINAGNNGSNEYQIHARTVNFGAGASLNSGFVPSGDFVDLVYRYRASDDLVSLTVNGSTVTGTAASTPVGGEGDVKIELAFVAGSFQPCHYQDIAIYSRHFTDDEVSSYRYLELAGNEADLIGSWHFTEGSGSTVADSTGTSDLTLTGGTWGQMVNPSPRYSTGILEAIGQWYRRSALRISTGTSAATTSAISAAPRDLTMSCLLELPSDFPSGTDTEVFAYGPTYANGEGVFSVDSSGQVVITSNRGTPDTVTSSTIRGSGVVRARLVLQSVDNTTSNLSLYLGTGTSAESLVGTVTVGPYDAVASCKVLIGDVGAGSDNSHARISDVRVFGAVRLEAEDDLLAPCDLSDPSLIESLRLDGDVASDIVPARAYTTNSLTYETVQNPNVTREAPGREGLGYPYTSGREQIEAELLDYVADADVEASEIFLEIWDRSNADGYVRLGALCCWATARPDENRVTGSERGWKARKALRTEVDGTPHLEDTHEGKYGRVQLKYLDIISEQDEFFRRVLRARRDKLVALVIEPSRLIGVTKTALPQHLLVDYTVVGTLSTSTRSIKEANERHVELEIEVEEVRRQTA